ncbi:GNAT family N-acetyltransferase [bacterium 1XD21-13]|nr:GNAT family N-acetyltransferase [bacterium 1XD21-13]
MDLSKVTIRPMRDGEQKEIQRIGKRAFQFVEALFVGRPKRAMAAEYEGKLVGGILYKEFNAHKKRIAYIDEAFVDPDYQGLGIGKKLYTKTFEALWEQNYQVLTALVKDDNAGSWKPFWDNGFRRVSVYRIIKEIGVTGFLKHYLFTPYLIAVGMDFYMCNRENTVEEKVNAPLQLFFYFFLNLLLLFPLWSRWHHRDAGGFLWNFLAYGSLLALFIGSRYLGKLISGNGGKFRFNQGGSFLLPVLGFFGNVFFMNANWYPEHYENTDDFRKRLAIPEIIKWFLFALLPWTALLPGPYCQALGRLASPFLIFMMIPFYPFEIFGGGRIYRYKKWLWLIMFIIAIAECFVIS